MDILGYLHTFMHSKRIVQIDLKASVLGLCSQVVAGWHGLATSRSPVTTSGTCRVAAARARGAVGASWAEARDAAEQCAENPQRGGGVSGSRRRSAARRH